MLYNNFVNGGCNMLTEFGKVLRKIRIDSNELLKEMADKLEVTASYLSAVEHGKREIPSDWIAKLINIYDLGVSQIKELEDSAEKSTLSIKINLKGQSSDAISLANAFARKLKDFDQNDIDKIKAIMNKKGE